MYLIKVAFNQPWSILVYNFKTMQGKNESEKVFRKPYTNIDT